MFSEVQGGTLGMFGWRCTCHWGLETFKLANTGSTLAEIFTLIVKIECKRKSAGLIAQGQSIFPLGFVM